MKSGATNIKGQKKNILGGRLGLLIILVALIIIFTVLSKYFMTWDNISQLLLSISIIGIISIGMTCVIIGGGLDLSVSANVALTATMVGYILHNSVSLKQQGIAFVVGLGIGAVIGLMNGLLITRLKINPLITTLATMVIVRGIAFLFSKGLTFGIFGSTPQFPNFGFWGRGYILTIPIPVILMIIVLLIVFVILHYTILGREIYIVGGNEEAATVSGINVNKVKIMMYLFSGVLSAFAGIILASRLAAGIPSSGQGYELSAIAAVVLGGASLKGGNGRVLDTMLAVLVIGILANGFVLMGLNTFLQDVTRGLILLISVGIDQFRQRRTV